MTDKTLLVNRGTGSFPQRQGLGEPAAGGHFAAFEQPDLFANEICSFFRLIR